MLTATALIFLLSSEPNYKVLIDKSLGIKFRHPADWKVKNQKSKTTLTMKLLSGVVAAIDISEQKFFESKEKWNEYQAGAAKDSGRTITRSWEELILGAPLLLNLSTFRVSGQELNLLTGLFYTRTDKKLFFRFTTPVESYGEVESAWRTVLLTLGTLDGSAMESEMPGRVITPTKGGKQGRQVESVDANKDPDRPKPIFTISGDVSKIPIRVPKGAQMIETSAGGTKRILTVPSGWTVTPVGDRFECTKASISGKVVIEPLSNIDSAEPAVMLQRAAGKGLEPSDSNVTRKDEGPMVSPAGAELRLTRRSLTRGASQLVQLFCVGSRGDGYWLLSYQNVEESAFKKEEKEIRSLINGLLLLNAN